MGWFIYVLCVTHLESVYCDMEAWSQKDVDEYLARTGLHVPARAVDGLAPPEPAKQVHKLGRGKRVELDSYKFASRAEADRYVELKWLQQAGQISGLEVHPWWSIDIKNVHICNVFMDFSYWERKPEPRLDGKGERMLTVQIVEDIKAHRIGKDGKEKFSTDTRISKIGRKLLLANFGIEVKVLYR